MIHISCLENRLQCWALGQDRGREGRAGTCPSLTRVCVRKWELSREAGCHTPTSPHTAHAQGEGDVLTPGLSQAWSQTVLSSNPPKSLPGIGISPGLVCNLAASCTVVGHTCQVFITDQISLGVTLIPTMSEQEKCHRQEAIL